MADRLDHVVVTVPRHIPTPGVAACGYAVSHATFRNMLRASTVPKRLDMVDAFAVALRGTMEDRQRWASAWRRFTVPAPQAASPGAEAEILHLASAPMGTSRAS